MAKTIIIIEDTPKDATSFEVNVVKFQTPDEQRVADTSAIVVGNFLVEALRHGSLKMPPAATRH